MKNIIALVDFSDVTSRVLNYTQVLASALGSEVILLHVAPLELPVAAYGVEIPPIPVDLSPATLQANQAKLDEMMGALKQHGISVTARQSKGPVAETVLAEVSALKADIVIMGSHHHNALYNLFIGSMTTDVLKHATFPVLVVPSDVPELKKAQTKRFSTSVSLASSSLHLTETGLSIRRMGKGPLSTIMQVPDIHLSRVAFSRQCGFVYGCIFCLMQIIRLYIAPQQEASGGEIMYNGTVAHDVEDLRVKQSDAHEWQTRSAPRHSVRRTGHKLS